MQFVIYGFFSIENSGLSAGSLRLKFRLLISNLQNLGSAVVLLLVRTNFKNH